MSIRKDLFWFFRRHFEVFGISSSVFCYVGKPCLLILFISVFQEVEFSFQIFQRNKNFSIDPAFSNWISFIERVASIRCARNSKSFPKLRFV